MNRNVYNPYWGNLIYHWSIEETQYGQVWMLKTPREAVMRGPYTFVSFTARSSTRVNTGGEFSLVLLEKGWGNKWCQLCRGANFANTECVSLAWRLFWAKNNQGPKHSDPPPNFLKELRQGFPGGSVVKNMPCNAGDSGSIPGPGRPHMLLGN